MSSNPVYDRLLMGSPLRRRGACVVFGGFLVLILIFASVVHVAVLASMRIDVVLVLYQALFLSTLLSIVPLSILWYLDRRERETPWLFVVAFLWGGSIATAIALPINTTFFGLVDLWVRQNPMIIELLGTDATLLLAAPISAPISEEIAKAFGVLILFWLLRAEFDNVRDGLIYGAIIGVGFTWYESALYVAQGYVQYGTAPFGLQLGARYALFGLGGHALFTGMFGAFLGFAMQTRFIVLRILAPIVGLLLAILAHIVNNILPLIATLAGASVSNPPQQTLQVMEIGFFDAFLSASILQLTIFLPFLVIVALVLWRSGVWERRVIREELEDEVGRAVTPAEYEQIVKDRMFRTRRISSRRPKLSAALVNAQHELAFSKYRARRYGRDLASDPIILGWREDIRRLREVV